MTSSATIETAHHNTVIDPVPLSVDQVVLAAYRSHYDAEKAVRSLGKDGLPMGKISIIGRNFETQEDVQGFFRPGDAALAGAETGAWFGGLFGLLVGTGLFIVPVIGPVFVLGPLAAIVAGAIGGAGLGALINTLLFLGIPQNEAIKYQEHIQAGEFLVLIHGATTAETDLARRVLKNTGHLSLQTHSFFHGGAMSST